MSTVYPVAGSKIYIGPAWLGSWLSLRAISPALPGPKSKGWTTAAAIGDTQNFGTQSIIRNVGNPVQDHDQQRHRRKYLRSDPE